MKKIILLIGGLLSFLLQSSVYAEGQIGFKLSDDFPKSGFRYKPLNVTKITTDRMNGDSLTDKSSYVDVYLPVQEMSWLRPPEYKGELYDLYPYVGILEKVELGISVEGKEIASTFARIADEDDSHNIINTNVLKPTVVRMKMKRPLKVGEKISLIVKHQTRKNRVSELGIQTYFDIKEYELLPVQHSVVLHPTIDKEVSTGVISGTGTSVGAKIKVTINGRDKEAIVDTDKKWQIIWDQIVLNKSEMIVYEKEESGNEGTSTIEADLPAKLSLSNEIEPITFSKQPLIADSKGYIDAYPTNKNWGISLYDSTNDGRGSNWQIQANLVDDHLVSIENPSHVLKDVLYYKEIDNQSASIKNSSGLIFTNNSQLSQLKNNVISLSKNTPNQSVKYKDNAGFYLHIPISEVYAENYKGTLNITLASLPVD